MNYQNNLEIINKIKIKRSLFALSETQRKELLEISVNNEIHNAIIKTQLECGLRIGEIANLTIPKINFIEKIIFVEALKENKYVKAWHPKTTFSQRIVPFTDSLKKTLRIVIGKRKEGYVFLSRKKKNAFQIESLINMINYYAKKCNSIGRTIGSNALRRTYASFLIKKGIPIGTISKVLGHKDIKTTMLYLYDIADISDFDKTREILKGMNK
ncbi:tyrosine-type recombinase/integrase [Candidatus Lokiarchaeum ossiferum]|uniref:tyrosine-type recombinase/integrase n=1 Tax=Candidatus Lokiarchaeum ossiferum TaxID=2951803 RepID=UPI00352C5213